MSRQRTEVIDGREFVVTRLPQDKRLEPGRTRKRQMFAALTSKQKRDYIDARKVRARKRRRRRRKRGGA